MRDDRLTGLDFLRALACLLVFMHHAVERLDYGGLTGGWRPFYLFFNMGAFGVAIFFLLTLFLVPFIGLVPPVATAPALIVVGFLMFEPVVQLGFNKITDGLPAFLALITMPLTYSIADGMFVGIVSYVVLKTLTGKIREVSWIMWVFAALLILAKVLDAASL